MQSTEQPCPPSRPRVLRKHVILYRRPGEPERSLLSPVWREGHGPEQTWALAWLEEMLEKEELMGRSRMVVKEWVEEVSL